MLERTLGSCEGAETGEASTTVCDENTGLLASLSDREVVCHMEVAEGHSCSIDSKGRKRLAWSQKGKDQAKHVYRRLLSDSAGFQGVKDAALGSTGAHTKGSERNDNTEVAEGLQVTHGYSSTASNDD